MKIKEFLYYLWYGFTALILRIRKPIVAGVSLTDRCNLECVHCVVANTGRGDYSFTRLREIFRTFYGRGARIIYLQGGEVFTWSDNGKKLNDVIRLAREVGFFKVAIVTNGTFPIEADADAVWVSLDGTQEYHDKIRGKGNFAATLNNIRNSSHPNISINITVNKINKYGIEELIKNISREKTIRGISVNLHTPYPGVEDKALDRAERAEVLEKVISLKKQGYRILNSMYGLKALMSGSYKRPVYMIQILEQDKMFDCCWGSQYKGVCEQCGYGIIPELSGIQNFSPGALLGALRLFKY